MFRSAAFNNQPYASAHAAASKSFPSSRKGFRSTPKKVSRLHMTRSGKLPSGRKSYTISAVRRMKLREVMLKK